MTSPLGKYAQIVAVVVVVGTIGAWLLAVLTANASAVADIGPYATLAFGAVLGSAATVNGYKRDQAAIHKRLDEAGIGPARDG